MNAVTRRTKLVYNDKTGMFEDVPVVGRRFSEALRLLSWPFRKIRSLLYWTAKVLFLLLVWFFYPAIKWWKVIRRDYREGEYILVALWLIPGYIMFLLYRGVILWFFGVGWLLFAAIAVCLWRWLILAVVRMWDFFSSLVAMTANTIPWR